MWTLLCLTSFTQNYATFIHITACIVAYSSSLDFPGGSDGKASAYSVGDPGSIPGSGRSPGEVNGNPLQHPCLQNPMDRGASWAIVHRVVNHLTRLFCSGDSLHVLLRGSAKVWSVSVRTHHFFCKELHNILGFSFSSVQSLSCV